MNSLCLSFCLSILNGALSLKLIEFELHHVEAPLLIRECGRGILRKARLLPKPPRQAHLLLFGHFLICLFLKRAKVHESHGAHAHAISSLVADGRDRVDVQ